MPGPSELARIEEEQADNAIGPEVGLAIPLDGPQVFGSISIRVTLIPPVVDQNQKLLALEQVYDTDVVQAIANRVHRGTVELDITDAFGKQRTMRVSPAELIILLQQAERFVQELPR